MFAIDLIYETSTRNHLFVEKLFQFTRFLAKSFKVVLYARLHSVFAFFSSNKVTYKQNTQRHF